MIFQCYHERIQPDPTLFATATALAPVVMIGNSLLAGCIVSTFKKVPSKIEIEEGVADAFVASTDRRITNCVGQAQRVVCTRCLSLRQRNEEQMGEVTGITAAIEIRGPCMV